MKILKSFLVTAMGVLLGMVLAGVGGLSAETLFFKSNKAYAKKIQQFWSNTGLSSADAGAIVSNKKCKNSKHYFNACLNAIVQNLGDYKVRLSETTGRLEAASENEHTDLSEKLRLQPYLKLETDVDFDRLLSEIFAGESESKKSMLAANLINAFMAYYFDPHTYIVPGDYFREVGIKNERSKYFVGLSHEKKRGRFVVQKIAKNSDADLAGLKPNDEIISLNDRALNNLKSSEFSSLLRNEQTEFFDLKIQRRGTPLNIKFVRSYRILSHVQFALLKKNKTYGVLTISKFNRGACREVQNILNTKVPVNLKGIILDLRDNPGGQLDEAACISGLFLGPEKKAYYVEYFDSDRADEVILTSEKQVYAGAMVTLVNHRTASAAELLAGSLQDYKRSMLVGERTFGKGSFQEPEDWPLNDKISLFKTQGYYLLPGGRGTQLVGVSPDIEVRSPDATGAEIYREENYFSRPLSANLKKQRFLSHTSAVTSANSERCKVARAHAHADETEDFFLAKSLQVLKCSTTGKLALNGLNGGKASAEGL